jgi:hypothetical protein
VYIWALRSQGVEPLAKAFCRVHELHYQTKAREDGLHENFDCYNFAYRKDMKTPVVSYRTKWPTGWKSEWFYVKIDEKKKLVQSPLKQIFGLTRPQCNMTPGDPCQDVVYEFRIVSEHIGTRQLYEKEDQLMSAAFGSRPKRRMNRVMDALHFEYLDYERLKKGVEGQKRKRVVSVVGRQAARMVKEDEENLKKKKLSPEPKAVASKNRKVAAPKQKATDIEEETPATPSATDVEEILKVMTESFPIKLSPLAPHLTKLFQKKKEPSITKKAAGPKK